MLKVKSGDRPRRPSDTSISWGPGGLNEDIWTLMEECWREDPTERPSISQILVRLAPALPVDQRPPESWDTLSTARFHLRKASAGGHLDAASLRGLHRIIDGLDSRLPFPSNPSPTLGILLLNYYSVAYVKYNSPGTFDRSPPRDFMFVPIGTRCKGRKVDEGFFLRML